MNLTKSVAEVAYLGKKELQLSAAERKLATFYKVTTTENPRPKMTHHLLLIDVSKSMDIYIDQLKATLVTTLKTLMRRKEQYVSLFLYSHHGQTYQVLNGVKCDAVSYELANVFEVIEKEVHVKDNTIFSEHLSKALDYISKWESNHCQHHLVLFSDGQAVPTLWSIEEEVNRCKALAHRCLEDGVVLNTIGFGKGYDRPLLMEMVKIARHGTFCHIDFIKDYKTQFLQFLTELKPLEGLALSVENEDYLIIDEHKTLTHPTTIQASRLNRTGLIVTFDGPLRGVENILESVDSLMSSHLAELGYCLASIYLQDERLEEAMIALELTGDVYALEILQNAYSFVEVGQAIKFIQNLQVKPNRRYKKGFNLRTYRVTQKEPLCVLDVLQDILNHKEAKLYWDYHYDYERIGIKKTMVENQYKFIRPRTGFGEISNVTIGSKKLNVGLRVKVWGQVENTLNHLKLDAFIFRDYNLILNGNLNTPYLWCELPKELKQKYRHCNIVMKVIQVDQKEICMLNLSKLKVTNQGILNAISVQSLAQKLYRCELLSCQLNCVKKYLQDIYEQEVLFNEHSDFCKRDTYKIHKAYRVKESGLYEPISVIKENELPYEVYKADILEWSIDRFPRSQVITEQIKRYAPLVEEDFNEYKARLNEVLLSLKKEYQTLWNEVNLIRLSSGLMKRSVFSWEEEKEKKKVETDPVLKINVIRSGHVIESKAKVDGIPIRQLKYSILVPLN